MPPHAGGEGMTGNRDPGSALPSILDIGEHGHPHNTHSRSRRTDSAPHGIGVKTKPAARVDLRSSPDPDPLPAVAHTEPGNNPNRSTNPSATGIDTAPLLQG
jgi:hypothetical protein